MPIAVGPLGGWMPCIPLPRLAESICIAAAISLGSGCGGGAGGWSIFIIGLINSMLLAVSLTPAPAMNIFILGSAIMPLASTPALAKSMVPLATDLYPAPARSVVIS